MERSIMSRTILTILQYQYSNLLRGSHWRSSKAEKNHCNNVETCWFTILWLLFIYLGLRYAIKGEDVLPNIWNLKRIIRGLFFTDQSDPRQNWYALVILESFMAYDFGNQMTRNFQKYIKYVKKLVSAHFIGKFSNFHKDILEEVTPQFRTTSWANS